MTTLDVRVEQLKTAVAPFPAVKDLRVSAQFPHGMRIRVIEQVPVGAVVVGGRTIPVAGDGTLLHDVNASASLPTIPLRVAAGRRAADRVRRAERGPGARSRSRPAARTDQPGDDGGAARACRPGSQRAQRSTSATPTDSSPNGSPRRRCSRTPGSAGALYIDVTVPGRPVAGAGSSSSAAATGGSSSASAPLRPLPRRAPLQALPRPARRLRGQQPTGTSASPTASGG